jgi:hypothetical protein
MYSILCKCSVYKSTIIRFRVAVKFILQDGEYRLKETVENVFASQKIA